MPEPTPAEVIPKIIVKEAIPATPTAGTAEERAQKVRQKLDEGAWREAAELRREPSIDSGRISQKAEQIGVERDPATGKKLRNTQEQSRYDELKKAADLARKFAEKGYGSMLPGEQTALRNVVLQEAKLRPTFAREIARMSLADQDRFVERILQDPKFSGEVRQIFDQLLNPENTLADAVTSAKEAFDEVSLRRDDKQEEIDDVDRRLGAVNVQLTEFARPGGGATPGAKAQELDNLRLNLTTTQSELRTHMDTLRDAQGRLEELLQEKQSLPSFTRAGITGLRTLAEIETEIVTTKRDVRNEQKEVDDHQAKIQRITDLEQQQQRLEEQKRELDKEKRQRELEMGKIRLEFNRRQYELQDAQALRESQEQDLVDGFKNIFSEATSNFLNKQVDEVTRTYETELENLKQQTKDKNEKAMYEALEKRWQGAQRVRMRGFPGFRKKETYRPIDRARVDADFDILRNQGPEVLMRAILTGRINPATGVAYTPTEISALLADKAFIEKMQPESVKQLLARKVLSGGIAQEDIFTITNSKWGEGMIEQALAKNEEFRKNVEAVLGAGALSGHGFLERFGQEIRKHPWWLLLLLGIPFLVAGAAKLPQTEANIAA